MKRQVVIKMSENEREQKIKNEPGEEKSKLKGDYGNMALLLFLYFLQGSIGGLAMTIPILLQNRGVSYKEQALYSISHYPFSCEYLYCKVCLFWFLI